MLLISQLKVKAFEIFAHFEILNFSKNGNNFKILRQIFPSSLIPVTLKTILTVQLAVQNAGQI